jgi:hypothetical protein
MTIAILKADIAGVTGASGSADVAALVANRTSLLTQSFPRPTDS